MKEIETGDLLISASGCDMKALRRRKMGWTTLGRHLYFHLRLSSLLFQCTELISFPQLGLAQTLEEHLPLNQ
jgi:hypothetical protein